jgi:hypothetical protein
MLYVIEYEFISVWGYETDIWKCDAPKEDNAKYQFWNYVQFKDDETYDYSILDIYIPESED